MSTSSVSRRTSRSGTTSGSSRSSTASRSRKPMPEISRSSGSEARHEPVLVAEVVEMIAPVGEGTYVDCTLGLGGHTAALLAAGAGRVIAIDRDADALALAGERLGEQAANVTRVHADYRDLGH